MEHLESRAFEACPCPSKEVSGGGGNRRGSQPPWRGDHLLLLVGLGSGEVAWAVSPGVSDLPRLCMRILLWKPINIDDHAVAEAEAVRGSGNVSLPSPNKNGGPVRFLRRPVFSNQLSLLDL